MENEHSVTNEVEKRRQETEEQQEHLLQRKCVYVVVLGDIGHSPRMRYHAMSLTNNGYFVQMIGYGGNNIPDDLEQNPYVWIRSMKEPPPFLRDLPKLLSFPLKVIWQTFFLLWVFLWSSLAYRFYPDFILVQNPPAVPTLGVCWLMSKIYSCPFIVDWHNYGYSIMALNTSSQHPLVTIAKAFENYFGAKADYSISVTRAMQADLKNRLGIDATTLYDRPPDFFKSLTKEERITFLKKFSVSYPLLNDVVEGGELGSGRPGILISSTSWTEDEDFNILLLALKQYEAAKNDRGEELSSLIVFITGKGPLKSHYYDIIQSLHFQHVHIFLPWLSHEDYPKLIGCADLGVSLHTSSSGLDLPMKVVDMYGSGLPVAAMNFNCISELVHHEKNGLIFSTSDELAVQIQDWFKISHTPNERNLLFRENIKSFQALRWETNWNNQLGPIFRQESTTEIIHACT